MRVRQAANRLARRHLAPATIERLRALDRFARFAVRRRGPIDRLPAPYFVTWAYRMVLYREPDPEGKRAHVRALRTGRSRHQMLDVLRGSNEYRENIRFSDLLTSLHQSRCDFVGMLPRAERIVDLGGTHQNSRDGALVHLGYPYPFQELTIIDLPHAARHELYQHSENVERVDTKLGPVYYRYHSMTDLSAFADGSVDLVYSGQTIEHVYPDEVDQVLAETRRILRPGGWFACDTPNGPVCRLQSPALINPDHKVEYSHKEFSKRLEDAGLDIVAAYGLNYLGHPVEDGVFAATEVAANRGVYFEIEDCYLLAYLCRKPLPTGHGVADVAR